MQGAIYFPFIAVPPTAWWTRTMLYWDYVGTIVPRSYTMNPNLLDPYTLELVRAGLLKQILPEEAQRSFGPNFARFLHSLPEPEVEARRRSFSRRSATLIHHDKWMNVRSGLGIAVNMGLAKEERDGSPWIRVERTTAAEFMAALTIALCQGGDERHGLLAQDGNRISWLPTTDRSGALKALLAGLRPDGESAERRRQQPIRAEVRASDIRTEFLAEVLPVPDRPVPTEKLVQFRKKHSDLLPSLRRFVEAHVDELLKTRDEDLQFRHIDQIRQEVELRTAEAEAYLREAGFRRVRRSSLLRVARFIPGTKPTIDSTLDLAGQMESHPDFLRQPLAYLAFARAEFAPVERYVVDPYSGVPLIDAFRSSR